MPQFTVYKNKDPRTKTEYPLLLDVQADLLDELQTRVVIPLTKEAGLGRKPIDRLTPHIDVEGKKYLLMTPQLAGVSRSGLGAPVENISAQRDAVIAALDTLVTGV